MKPRRVEVNDRMQCGYVYLLTEPPGEHFHPGFRPDLTPAEMLELGVFGGKYLTDCRAEFPAGWFANARLCAERHDPRLNCFGVNASQLIYDLGQTSGRIQAAEATREASRADERRAELEVILAVQRAYFAALAQQELVRVASETLDNQTKHVTQSWKATHEQINGGAMDGFVRSASGARAPMGYYTPEVLPFAYSLASQFTIGDRWFCSMPGPTYPNRRFLLAGTAFGATVTAFETLLDPPGVRATSGSHGFHGVPRCWLVPQPPIANSTVCVLPITMSPAALSLCAKVAV